MLSFLDDTDEPFAVNPLQVQFARASGTEMTRLYLGGRDRGIRVHGAYADVVRQLAGALKTREVNT